MSAFAWKIALVCTAVMAGLPPSFTVPAMAADTPAQTQPLAPMTNARLEQLIRRIDPAAQGRPGFWQFAVEKRRVLVITDERADRMRIISEIAVADSIDPQQLYRLMQANFDSALDARYAIGRNVLWSTFLHPLKTLHEGDFISGVGQVINLAESYGSVYSSGGVTFGGGDSSELKRRELIEKLRRKAQEKET